MELKVEIKRLNLTTVVATPDAGCRVCQCTEDAVALCAAKHLDVEFVFNDELYRVQYSDLLSRVQVIKSGGA